MSTITPRKTCRISGERLKPLFSLGPLRVSDFVNDGNAEESPMAELKLCLAPKSGLVQLAHTVDPDNMYRRYWYKSGTNATMTNELQQIAESAQQLIKTAPGDVFIDIGCNDGTLFRFLHPKLVKIGFDPAKNNAEEAKNFATLVIPNYFNFQQYKKTPYGAKKAKIVTAIAMFYDLDNPHAFVQDVKKVLDDQGLWIIQMSYLPLMLKQLAFDNICHEHLKYYSLSSLKYLLDQHNFKIVDCQLNDTNGGSFRVYIRKDKADPTKFATAPHRDVAEFRVASLLTFEKNLALNKTKTYLDFFKEAQKLKAQTISFIKREKQKGKKIWGYGASTKGNTLLQWFNLDHQLIDGIAERSPSKYGLRTVGTNIPIFSEEEMRKARPDYLLILPWHFINEFKSREANFLKQGGKLIVPCPKFEIIGKES